MRATHRTTPHRLAERLTYDTETVHGILDAALICHVGVDADGPLVLPLIHARIGDTLYLHASTGSGLALAAPMQVCLTATIVDGLVLAKSQFHHSMNYRCAVVRGVAEPVTDPVEKKRALAAVVEHVIPGRSRASRPGNHRELAATAVLRLRLAECSAKMRTGPPSDEPEDAALPYWSGVLPVALRVGHAQPDDNCPAELPAPEPGNALAG